MSPDLSQLNAPWALGFGSQRPRLPPRRNYFNGFPALGPPGRVLKTVKCCRYWFYIDDRDQENTATLTQVLQLMRLNLATRRVSGPLNTPLLRSPTASATACLHSSRWSVAFARPVPRTGRPPFSSGRTGTPRRSATL